MHLLQAYKFLDMVTEGLDGYLDENKKYILDHKDSLSKAAIGRTLKISADRVCGVINGKSYKDLVEIYYKNKSCRE